MKGAKKPLLFSRVCREVDCLPGNTFTPLSRGRVRCRRTQRVMRAYLAPRHRHSLGCEDASKCSIKLFDPVVLSPPLPVLKRAVRDRDGSAYCPECFRWNQRVHLGKNRCVHCGKEFITDVGDPQIVMIYLGQAATCNNCARDFIPRATGVFVCPFCPNKLRVSFKTNPVRSDLRVGNIDEDGDVFCPECMEMYSDVKTGSVIRCRDCGIEFQAI